MGVEVINETIPEIFISTWNPNSLLLHWVLKVSKKYIKIVYIFFKSDIGATVLLLLELLPLLTIQTPKQPTFDLDVLICIVVSVNPTAHYSFIIHKNTFIIKVLLSVVVLSLEYHISILYVL